MIWERLKYSLCQVHLDPIYKEIRVYTYEDKNDKGIVVSDYIPTDKSNLLIADYVKEHFNLVVYGCLIRTTKYEIGIKYKGYDKGICTFNNVHMTLEKFDACYGAKRFQITFKSSILR